MILISTGPFLQFVTVIGMLVFLDLLSRITSTSSSLYHSTNRRKNFQLIIFKCSFFILNGCFKNLCYLILAKTSKVNNHLIIFLVESFISAKLISVIFLFYCSHFKFNQKVFSQFLCCIFFLFL